MFPEKKLVTDYRFDGIETWWPWLKSEDILFSSDETLPNALVPTKHTSIIQYWLERALKIPRPIAIIGPCGAGKSVTIQHYLNTLPKEKFLSNTINLSTNTSPKHVQELIMNKLDRRRKGVFGPPVGKSVSTSRFSQRKLVENKSDNGIFLGGDVRCVEYCLRGQFINSRPR